MMSGPRLALLVALAGTAAAVRAADETAAAPPAAASAEHAHPPSKFLPLQRKILSGGATLAEVRQALTDEDIGALTNTVHGLYSMRWHRGVYTLLHDMWDLKKDDAPEINWTQIAKPPVRLALASTLIRIELTDNRKYVDYLREHRYDAHEFHRAQVLIGLAFKGELGDIDYMVEMADGTNPFVAQSAITALALMNVNPARDALIGLLKKWRGDPRGKVMEDVLRQAYHWPPEEKSPGASPAPAANPAPAKN